MKLKRFSAILCLGLALTILLTGCGFGGFNNKPLPEGMDKDKLIAAGQEVFELLREGEFEEVSARFRADIREKNGVTAEFLREQMETYVDPAAVGAFVKIKQTVVSGETAEEEHGFVAFECKYTKKTVAVAVAFDLQMNLIGLSFAHD